MVDFIVSSENDYRVQTKISQTIENYNKGSHARQSQISQNASIQSSVLENTINNWETQ